MYFSTEHSGIKRIKIVLGNIFVVVVVVTSLEKSDITKKSLEKKVCTWVHVLSTKCQSKNKIDLIL